MFKLDGVDGLPADEPAPTAVPATSAGHEGGRSDDNGELPSDIAEALTKIEHLDAEGLRQAAVPEISRKQSDRLAVLNRKAQDDGLSRAEEVERDKLLHLYEKSMVVRAKRWPSSQAGLDVSDLIAVAKRPPPDLRDQVFADAGGAGIA